MDVLRCSAAREWARRVVGRWWSGDLSGLLDAGGGGEVGDGDGLVAVGPGAPCPHCDEPVAVGAWRAWPEPAAELVALLAALAAEVAGVACGALVDTGRAGRRAGLGGWRGGVVALAPGGLAAGARAVPAPARGDNGGAADRAGGRYAGVTHGRRRGCGWRAAGRSRCRWG